MSNFMSAVSNAVDSRATRQMACASALFFVVVAALAQQPAQVLETVTVTATRTEEAPYNVPASISVVPGDEFYEASLGVNMSDGVKAVPGLLARNRQNYSQEEQISIRGFGASSTFGISGLRLYVDDIPATQPDGQGASSNFNFASAERVEVLRGPFSALYGNSAGGVVALYTEDGNGPFGVSGGVAAGSYGTVRTDLGTSGEQGIADYNLHFTHFQTDGYRDHSQARRESLNGKVNLQLSQRSRLSLIANYLSAPDVQDPLGLSPVMYNANPRQVIGSAKTYNTRKSTQQTQFGAIYEYQLSEAQTFRALTYYGQRQVEQFLSIPMGNQAAPQSPGGAINLNNAYGGADARWTYRSQLLQRPISLVLGLTYDQLHEHRRGYNNFDGLVLGVQGALRRDEINTVYNFDQYAEANWAFAEQWSALLGVRRSQVNFNSDNQYPVDADHPDSSGSKTYVSTSPVIGLMFKARPWLHTYASYGTGFQTPTIAQLAYRPDATAGLNFDLDAARSKNAELGAKMRLGEHTKAAVAVFHASTDDEVVIFSNSNGRSTFQNIGSTWRRGVEVGVENQFAKDWKAQLSYTYLNATVREPYLTCGGPGCAVPTVPVAAGNRLPGVPRNNVYGAMSWGRATGFNASANAQFLSSIPANDSNTVFASSYALFGLEAAYVLKLEHWSVRPFVRIDNLLDRRYVSALSVNDGNGRFYFPGTDRTALAGVSFNWK